MVRFDDEELALIQQAASKAEQQVGTWIRTVCVRAAKRRQ
jgi:hypothetical protein